MEEAYPGSDTIRQPRHNCALGHRSSNVCLTVDATPPVWYWHSLLLTTGRCQTRPADNTPCSALLEVHQSVLIKCLVPAV